jgi:NCS1 family nucleobase:cation symporter-1
MSSALYTGPIAKVYLGGADISYFISMLVSAAIYLVAVRALRSPVKAEAPASQSVGEAKA